MKYNVKMGKNDLSQYVSGKIQPGQDKLTILGLALNVNEVWLMGYNVPKESDALKGNNTIINASVQESNISSDEQELLNNYRQLNEEGQERLLETSEELTEMAKYKKHTDIPNYA